MHARVVVLAGPSGSGKTRLAHRLGLPVLRLDDFYKDVGDPTLPRVTHGANAGIVDWDHPDSWHRADAVEAIRTLCRTGFVDVPTYDIATSTRTGHHQLALAGHDRFVAEGIFAPLVVRECREDGLLAAAYCITQYPVVTFWRRLVRDLREHRKPPLLLLRRGIALMRAQRRIVQDAVAHGCVAARPEDAYDALQTPGNPRA